MRRSAKGWGLRGIFINWITFTKRYSLDLRSASSRDLSGTVPENTLRKSIWVMFMSMPCGNGRSTPDLAVEVLRRIYPVGSIHKTMQSIQDGVDRGPHGVELAVQSSLVITRRYILIRKIFARSNILKSAKLRTDFQESKFTSEFTKPWYAAGGNFGFQNYSV